MRNLLTGVIATILLVAAIIIFLPVIVKSVFLLGVLYVLFIGALILTALTILVLKIVLIPYYAVKKSGRDKPSKGITLDQLKEKERSVSG